jgi:hypothetical protein
VPLTTNITGPVGVRAYRFTHTHARRRVRTSSTPTSCQAVAPNLARSIAVSNCSNMQRIARRNLPAARWRSGAADGASGHSRTSSSRSTRPTRHGSIADQKLPRLYSARRIVTATERMSRRYSSRCGMRCADGRSGIRLCGSASGRLKASLRCAPALRGLDPPRALPEPGNYRSDGLAAALQPPSGVGTR